MLRRGHRSSKAEVSDIGLGWLHVCASEHVDELIQLMQAEQDPWLRGTFIELLAATKDRKVVPVLAAELEHPDEEVRRCALWSLKELDFREARKLVEFYNYKMNEPNE